MENRLPDSYCNRMKQQLGREWDLYLASFSSCPGKSSFYQGIRLNTGKITPEDFWKQFPWEPERIPWTKNGFYLPQDYPWSKDPYYSAGLFYLQEPSAMAPGAILAPNPGENVLDLCAAPGGKSTELSTSMQGRGLLVTNDISPSRARALDKNLAMWGAKNAIVLAEDSSSLAERFPGFFHKILLDAPCSGEGMFRKEKHLIHDWVDRGPDDYAPIQKKLLHDAFLMLRPGGKLLYSTCTFAPQEDEEQIALFLEEQKEASLVPMEGLPQETWMEGIGAGGKMAKFYPHRVKGEGHFLALLQKAPGEMPALPKESPGEEKIPESILEFLSSTGTSFQRNRLVLRKDVVFYQPEHLPVLTGLRVLREGTRIGTMKGDRFLPEGALSRILEPAKFPNVCAFTKGEEQVNRYLKCETIFAPGDPGTVLVTVDGFPLGFCQRAGEKLKNQYPSSWRLL